MPRGRRTTTPRAASDAIATTLPTDTIAAATGGSEANQAPTPAASNRNRSPLQEDEERRQRERADLPVVERVAKINNFCRAVFAALQIE
jgi:hypothetical protein